MKTTYFKELQTENWEKQEAVVMAPGLSPVAQVASEFASCLQPSWVQDFRAFREGIVGTALFRPLSLCVSVFRSASLTMSVHHFENIRRKKKRKVPLSPIAEGVTEERTWHHCVMRVIKVSRKFKEAECRLIFKVSNFKSRFMHKIEKF